MEVALPYIGDLAVALQISRERLNESTYCSLRRDAKVLSLPSACWVVIMFGEKTSVSY